MKISKQERYRSQPMVNMSYDSIRVTLLLRNWEWRKIRTFLKENVWEENDDKREEA